MALRYRDDLTLPLVAESTGSDSRRTPVAAFVPIAVALIGLALIMFGGATARDPATAVGVANQVQVDPIATGSIPERDRAYDLMMLDR